MLNNKNGTVKENKLGKTVKKGKRTKYKQLRKRDN
jgi:hypothetical protein